MHLGAHVAYARWPLWTCDGHPGSVQSKGTHSYQITNILPSATALENVRIAAQSRRHSWSMLTHHAGFRDIMDKSEAVVASVGLSGKSDELAVNLSHGEQRNLDFGEKAGLFEYGRPNKIVYDYSADGARRSIEDSLGRLGVGRVNFVWVHDVAQDFHDDEWLSQFETARKGAFRELTRLRDEGVIKGWGLGVNRVEPVELLLGLSEVKPDGTLLAGRYTLLDHEHALQRLMPAAAAKGVDIVIGGPYSSSVLAGGEHFEYADAPPEILAKVEKIKALAERHRVPIKAAALQFSLAHPASAAVIPGASKPDRIKEDPCGTEGDHPGRLLARDAQAGTRRSQRSATHRPLSEENRYGASICAHRRSSLGRRGLAPDRRVRISA